MMSMIKRFILFLMSLFLILTSLLHVIYGSFNPDISTMLIGLNIIVGSITAIYNLMIIYKKATTVHVVIESENIRNEVKNKKGCDEYV